MTERLLAASGSKININWNPLLFSTRLTYHFECIPTDIFRSKTWAGSANELMSGNSELAPLGVVNDDVGFGTGTFCCCKVRCDPLLFDLCSTNWPDGDAVASLTGCCCIVIEVAVAEPCCATLLATLVLLLFSSSEVRLLVRRGGWRSGEFWFDCPLPPAGISPLRMPFNKKNKITKYAILKIWFKTASCGFVITRQTLNLT